MGVGLEGVVGEVGGGLGASDVDAFHIHASVPSSRRIRNHFSLTSRIIREVPLLTLRIILPCGLSRKFSDGTVTCVMRRGGAGVTFGAGEGGGGEGFAGETVSDSDGGFAEGSSFLGCSVVGCAAGVGFVAGFVPEQPNKKNRAEINIRTFGMKPLDKYFMNFPLLFASPLLVFLVQN